MNYDEQLALDQTKKNYEQFINTKDTFVHHGTSRLVAGMIVHDVCAMNPSLDTNNYEELVAFANRFACTDGLLSVSINKGLDSDKIVRFNYQTALTTIWIAQFLKEIAKTRTTILKKQLSFQTCLLVYFFNQIIGVPPLKLSRTIEKETIKRYGLHNWYFDYSREHEIRKLMLFFDVMHLCGLEYRNPIDEVINT